MADDPEFPYPVGTRVFVVSQLAGAGPTWLEGVVEQHITPAQYRQYIERQSEILETCAIVKVDDDTRWVASPDMLRARDLPDRADMAKVESWLAE